jgi:hypothetical protein
MFWSTWYAFTLSFIAYSVSSFCSKRVLGEVEDAPGEVLEGKADAERGNRREEVGIIRRTLISRPTRQSEKVVSC